ncbi:histidinol-phosphate transaminase [Clostridium thermosuccinogenes]|jgi:histidinol-phosphate aminotransferase|uniref:Histidinol-phosphate aminotransferase n=1 Tax=Clostridium thermosuccinogenes TaxID=84032 RepID=A0A2K2FIT3_9CLOT|nr:histidinol-phosphate transaminase [Pseudoclostridium thermosuccinogenes]AUS98172.1 histidinol-phosphate transaminase [Pseudoclostridium thermosuccinogenes]PNT96850.1 histidinol-phosphate transaminase [Pseudoclostridium thermosuccinogenes]PNT98660.1 histidinol-phosphate transaminase [Pseudoclostridium thermosuccinogenes]
MNKYWSDVLKRLEPYVPGEQPKDKKYIKLNTNENPYPPSPRAIEAIRQAADERLRLYPAPDCDELKHVLAENLGVKKEQVFVGNGSDEVLAFSFAAFFNPGEPILFPDITYTFYPVYCQLYGIDYRTIPLDADFNIPVEGFLQDNGGIIFANPNAPTGKFMDLASVEKIVKENIERVVVIDEAYVDFGGQSAVKLIDKYPNLLVIKTLSKSHSLAGLRIGFALGNAGLIEGLDRVKNSFNSYTIDRIALAGAAEAIKDTAYFEKTRAKIIHTRKWVGPELEKLGFRLTDSLANFVFASHASLDSEYLFKALREKGVLVRYFNKPRINNYLRITIGTDQEMEQMIKVLKELI